ncbi:uracil-DNA glycosylase [Acholeplasma morum]|uniref:uracil-DNA glycosylase n=1 Tax=Paracholeplasma morum TaxID=264637 RepID=UPI00195C5DB9|nr:uracil-DNA glycosylase [Paracholeplasma morum]MBM7453441.1 uracil-DNA glycosylase [Paracholeplasma morum]
MTFDDIYLKESKKAYFIELLAFIESEYSNKTIYPPKTNLFQAFKLTPLNQVKVVIIGQDPYHNPNQANGLAFSVNENVTLPPSLKNIYKEIERSFGYSMSNNGALSSWAKQGVLLLNTILTVEENKPLSHQNKGWETFTLEIIKALNALKQPICFLLFGQHAKQYEKHLNNPNHLVLKTVHPSPLSAHRGFIGSDVFKKCNDYLKDKEISTIDWKV